LTLFRGGVQNPDNCGCTDGIVALYVVTDGQETLTDAVNVSSNVPVFVRVDEVVNYFGNIVRIY